MTSFGDGLLLKAREVVPPTPCQGLLRVGPNLALLDGETGEKMSRERPPRVA